MILNGEKSDGNNLISCKDRLHYFAISSSIVSEQKRRSG